MRTSLNLRELEKDREPPQRLIKEIILAMDPAESNDYLFDFILR